MRHKPLIATAGLALSLLLLAACGHSGSGAAAAASSAASAHPSISQELSTTEQELLTNIQKNWKPAHPVKSVEAGIKATYPQGSTAKIESFAVAHFTPAVLTTHGPGSERDLYLAKVTAYAQSLGAVPAGQAAIPGLQPSPSGSKS
jgi:hypothetical protein